MADLSCKGLLLTNLGHLRSMKTNFLSLSPVFSRKEGLKGYLAETKEGYDEAKTH